jgi:DNA-binding response OmpR family regulator
LQVLGAARESQPQALVIIITGHASLQTAIQAVRQGAYDYIRKPFKLEEMELALKNTRERIHLLRDNRRLLTELHQAYEQANLVKEIMTSPSPPELNHFSGGLEGPRQRGEPFIPGNSLPLSSLQARGPACNLILDRLERLAVLLEKGLISRAEFNRLKKGMLEATDAE